MKICNRKQVSFYFIDPFFAFNSITLGTMSVATTVIGYMDVLAIIIVAFIFVVAKSLCTTLRKMSKNFLFV